jgi:hypothetical protein
MRLLRMIMTGGVALALSGGFAGAQQPAPTPQMPKQFVYPEKGQTPQQQQKDEAECSTWATQQTGFNPANPVVVTQHKTGSVVGSGAMVKGAAAGAAVGAIGGNDVGNAAAKGAAVGAIAKLRANRRAAEQANQSEAQKAQAAMNEYLTARAVCLQARGYAVK